MTEDEYLFQSKLEEAEKGNPQAQQFIGRRYYEPKFGMVDYDKAVFWLRKAAEQNDLFADYDLALLYHWGYGVPQDDGKALEHYEKVKEKNVSADEMSEMVAMTERGKKRTIMPLEEVLKKAEQGDAEALCELGWRHYMRWEVEWSSEKALKCFEKAAQQGHAEARYFLYWMHTKGNSEDRCPEKAAVYCMEAAEQGHIAAQYHMGRVLERGIGVGKDYGKALEYYRNAEEKGHPYAKKRREWLEGLLAYMEKNKSEKLMKIIADAEAGNAEGQRSLGIRYMEGAGVPADPKLTVYWLEKAVEQGERVGQWVLGECYEKGYGVEKNIQKAVELYEMSGKQGIAEAYYCLGNLYKDGNGVEQSYVTAAMYYEQAVKMGHEKAMCELGHLYADGKGVPKSRSKAYNLYWRAVDEGYSFARVYLDLLE